MDSLLNRGFSIDTVDGSNHSMLMAAIVRNQNCIVEYLLHRDSTLLDRNPSCLHDTVRDVHPNLEIVKTLINAGAGVNDVIDENGHYPIHDAVYYTCNKRNRDVLEFLLNRGALVDARNDLGETALHLCIKSVASSKESREMQVRMLLNYGADCRLKTNAGETAYDLCKRFADMDSLANLLSEEMSLRESNFGFKK